ncbi:bacteriohemerythrin [Sediminispirochaeta bajacaliforniensis]|uniref:bacteriohemerythrin n=1 Tax=Sediminispirochaeta bajacaliforniensis TaxID=148 RepID=UPI00036C4A19|nr:bacteriohemerythrin [Sediminispirochaeta bajacaliforniensis]
MALISWNQSLSVGVDTFDDQHKVLIGHLNALHDAMRNGKSNEIIAKVLDELVKYTVYHFSSEEKAFEQYDYPDTDKHKAEHQFFTQKAIDLQEQFQAGKLFISVDALNFLMDWVQNHILGSDAAYRSFFDGKMVKAEE